MNANNKQKESDVEAHHASSWKPSTPAVHGSIDEVIEKFPSIVIHFWAEWDLVDRPMDEAIQKIRPLFQDQLRFFSCNIDDSENAQLVKTIGLVNIPYLGVYIDRNLKRGIMGLRSPEQLAEELEHRLNPAPNWLSRLWS